MTGKNLDQFAKYVAVESQFYFNLSLNQPITGAFTLTDYIQFDEGPLIQNVDILER